MLTPSNGLSEIAFDVLQHDAMCEIMATMDNGGAINRDAPIYLVKAFGLI